MEINIKEEGTLAILDIKGAIDVNSYILVEKIGWILENQTNNIILNFENVESLDYVGVFLLTVAYKNVAAKNGKIEIYNVPLNVKKLFAIVGLDKVFKYYETKEDVINAIKRSAPKAPEPEIKLDTQEEKRKKKARTSKRIPVGATIEYIQQPSRNNIFYKGKIINLSTEGVFISTKQLFSAGDILLVKMHLEPDPGIVEAKAKVVWLADKDVQPQYFPGMGLEFIELSSETARKINAFIDRCAKHRDNR